MSRRARWRPQNAPQVAAVAHGDPQRERVWLSGYDVACGKHVRPLVALIEEIVAVPMAAPALEAAGGLHSRARALLEEIGSLPSPPASP